MTSRRSKRAPKKAKRTETTEIDLYNFVQGVKDFRKNQPVIRSILDDDPIDLKRLETGLRDVLGAITKIRSSSISGNETQRLFGSHEAYYRSLLELMVGKQH